MWFLSKHFIKYVNGNVPFAVRNLAKKFVSDAIDQTAALYERYTPKLAELWVSLDYRHVHEHVLYTSTDPFKRQKKHPFPLLGQNELNEGYKKNNLFYIICCALLFGFEAYMFSFFCSNLSNPKTIDHYPWLPFIVGAFFAVTLVVCTHFALQSIISYIKSHTITQTEQVDRKLLLPFKTELVIGCVIGISIICFIVAVAPIRAHYMEGKDTSTGGPMLCVSLIGTILTSLAISNHNTFKIKTRRNIKLRSSRIWITYHRGFEALELVTTYTALTAYPRTLSQAKDAKKNTQAIK